MDRAQADRHTPSELSAGLTAAQRDMRNAYMGGAPGVLVSGLVWAVAGCIATWISPSQAVWALFVGGVFIHPVAVLLVWVLGRSGRHAHDNPLGALAMATTLWMILMLPLAYGVSLLRIELFFPAMLFVIAGRYLCFQTLYGTRLYWIFGAVLALAAYALFKLEAPVALSAFAGAGIEIAFAGLLCASERQEAGVLAASLNSPVSTAKPRS